MAAITTQIADQVVTLVNDARPFAGEVTASRAPIMHFGREDIEQDIKSVIVAGVRSSSRKTRSSWQREYPVQILIDRAVSTEETDAVDVLHETIEQVSEVLEGSPKVVVGTRNIYLTTVDVDTDNSGLTETQHLQFSLIAVYMEIHG